MARVICLILATASAVSAAELRRYDTAYYVMMTDIDADQAREAAIRMTRMAEEYYERTKDFSGQINQRFPFFLFAEPRDYYRAGGLPGSAGMFDGQRLMAMHGGRAGRSTWHVVQHEGFHQFARAVIGGQMPVWANEGLAEYFAHSVFTGDGFVTGVIPPARLKRIQDQIKARRFRPIPDMMVMSLAEWNAGLSVVNYDQGWSMVHFLAHAEGGKYQGAFAGFINAIGARRPWQQAWADNFGRDISAFEQRWAEFWLGLPANPTADLYAKATTATLTSFLARASAQKQSFDSFGDFIRSAEAGALRIHDDDWLSPALLSEAAAQAKKVGKWSLGAGEKGSRTLTCAFDEGTTWVGRYTLNEDRVARVWVDEAKQRQVTPAAIADAKRPPVRNRPTTPTTRPVATRPAGAVATVDPLVSAMNLARAYDRSGEKAKARAALERAIKEHPDSPAAADARDALERLK